MPAKNAKDLQNWNNENPDKKTYVRYSTENDEIIVYFCDEKGDELTAIRSMISDEKNRPHGKIRAFYDPGKPFGECLGAYIVKLTSQTLKGWGPMLYDCLIVLAGEKGVTPDRVLVTSEAAFVWKTYFEKRKSQLKTIALDLDGTLTPDNPDDDCTSSHKTMAELNSEEIDDITLNAINNVFKDKGISTLSELQNSGLVYNNLSESRKLKSFIRETIKRTLRQLRN